MRWKQRSKNPNLKHVETSTVKHAKLQERRLGTQNSRRTFKWKPEKDDQRSDRGTSASQHGPAESNWNRKNIYASDERRGEGAEESRPLAYRKFNEPRTNISGSVTTHSGKQTAHAKSSICRNTARGRCGSALCLAQRESRARRDYVKRHVSVSPGRDRKRLPFNFFPRRDIPSGLFAFPFHRRTFLPHADTDSRQSPIPLRSTCHSLAASLFPRATDNNRRNIVSTVAARYRDG